MGLIFGVFWVALGWGVYEAKMSWREAAIFAALWLLVGAGWFRAPHLIVVWFIGFLVLAGVMTLRIFGRDIVIR